jgi:hypothetical protein
VHRGWYDRRVRWVRDLSAGDARIYLELGVRHVRCLASNSVGDWNEFEVHAKGPCILVRLYGGQASRLEHGTRRLDGRIALQAHHAGSAVQFRNLRIRP